MEQLDYGKIGMRIRRLRKEKKWSQAELAERCGISMPFLGHIERGTRVMSLGTFAGICSALEADADELLFGAACNSKTVFGLWDAHASAGGLKKDAGKEMDTYTMYVRIMESVAEIMKEERR